MLTIDLDSAEPLHEQIVRGLRNAVASGVVRVGDRLPSVRQLAGDLGVNLNTVARAYRRLEDEGLVRVRHGQGVEVASDRVARPDTDRAAADLGRDLTDVVSRARVAGLGAADVQAALDTVLAAVFAGPDAAPGAPHLPGAQSRVRAASAVAATAADDGVATTAADRAGASAPRPRNPRIPEVRP